MARPAPNSPQGDNDYGNDDEAQDERFAGNPGKRAAPKPSEHAARRKQTQQQDDIQPEGKPVETAWQEVEPPLIADEPAADRDEKARAAPRRKSREQETRRDVKPAPAPGAEPVLPPEMVDAEWAEADVPPRDPADSTATAKAPKAGKRREYDIAGTVYLILLAILAASLSAAVVLFLF